MSKVCHGLTRLAVGLSAVALLAPALAQGGLLDGGNLSRGDAPGRAWSDQCPIQVMVWPASEADARLLAAMEAVYQGEARSIQRTGPEGGGMGVVLSFPDAATAARFFIDLGRMGSVAELIAETTTTVDLQNADPRSVRARLGAEALVRDSGVGIVCRLDPPQIALTGSEQAVASVAARVRALDVPAPAEPGPEDTVRAYIEKWLVPAEDAPAPDVAGMYALTTTEARGQISEAEFSAVLARTELPLDSSPGRSEGRGGLGAGASAGPMLSAFRTGELLGVYPPRLAEDGRSAVVAYSIAWLVPGAGFTSSRVQRGGSGFGGGMGASWSAGGYAGGMANSNTVQQQAITRPRSADDASLRLFAGIQRGQALVVREDDGSWRLPMLFDAAGQVWLTPLSPKLIDRLAPDLATPQALPEDDAALAPLPTGDRRAVWDGDR